MKLKNAIRIICIDTMITSLRIIRKLFDLDTLHQNKWFGKLYTHKKIEFMSSTPSFLKLLSF